MNPLINDDRCLADAAAETKKLFAADAVIVIPVYNDEAGGGLSAPILFDGINQAIVTKILQTSLKQQRNPCFLCTDHNQ